MERQERRRGENGNAEECVTEAHGDKRGRWRQRMTKDDGQMHASLFFFIFLSP